MLLFFYLLLVWYLHPLIMFWIVINRLSILQNIRSLHVVQHQKYYQILINLSLSLYQQPLKNYFIFPNLTTLPFFFMEEFFLLRFIGWYFHNWKTLIFKSFHRMCQCGYILLLDNLYLNTQKDIMSRHPPRLRLLFLFCNLKYGPRFVLIS